MGSELTESMNVGPVQDRHAMVPSVSVDACLAVSTRKVAALALVNVDAAFRTIWTEGNFIFKPELTVSISMVSRVANAIVSLFH